MRENRDPSPVTKAALTSIAGPFSLPIYLNRYGLDRSHIFQRNTNEFQLFKQFLRFWGIWTAICLILEIIAVFGTREVGFIIVFGYLVIFWLLPWPIYLLFVLFAVLFGPFITASKSPISLNISNKLTKNIRLAIITIGTLYGLFGMSNLASSLYEATINRFDERLLLGNFSNTDTQTTYKHITYIKKMVALKEFVEGSTFCLIALLLIQVKKWGRYLLMFYSAVTVTIIFFLKFHMEVFDNSKDLAEYSEFFSNDLTFRAILSVFLILLMFIPPVKKTFIR